MFIKAVFLASICAAVMAQIPAPTCFSSGSGGASNCAQFISNFCADVAPQVIRTGDNSARCYNLNSTNRCNFIAFNGGPQMGPSRENCIAVLNNIANLCPTGGFGRVQNTPVFTFTLDPNTGACSQLQEAGN